MAPSGPLIVAAGTDLLVFATPADAEGYLEAIDVEQGEYEAAWDGTGRRVALRVRAEPYRALFGLLRGRAERVTAREVGPEPDEAGLRERIARFLASRGVPPPAPGAHLGSHVDALVAHVGYTGGRRARAT